MMPEAAAPEDTIQQRAASEQCFGSPAVELAAQDWPNKSASQSAVKRQLVQLPLQYKPLQPVMQLQT